MIRHYFSSTFAAIARTPFTTAANILTLALGLACFLAAFGIATYWKSADSHHAGAERTVVIGQSNTGHGMQQNPLTAMSSWSMAKYLREDFPEIEHVARAMSTPDVAVAADANKVLLNQGTVDPAFLEIFDLDFKTGDPRTALNTPDSAVITEEAAARLFGGASAMGRTILVNGAKELTVTGVIAPPRQPSFMGAGPDAVFQFDFLRNWKSNIQTSDLDNFESWMGLLPWTFAVLPKEMTPDALNARLPAFIKRRVPAEQQASATTIMRAFPVSELMTFDLDRNLFSSGGVSSSTVTALLALAALTLVIAGVNYANLATAQATSRAKEIGMQRVLGASAIRVMGQAWLEAILLTALAAVIAIGVLALAAPFLQATAGIDLLYFLSGELQGFGVLIGLIVAVAFFAGAYPALILSRVRPTAALRSGRSRSGSRLVTHILVAIQFASAGFLLILVTVTQLQRSHLEQVALGSREDPAVILNDLVRVRIDFNTLAARLESQPGIRAVSVTDIPPWSSNYNGVFFARTADAGAKAVNALVKSIGYDYFNAMSLDLLAGRDFDRQRDTARVSFFNLQGVQLPGMIVDWRYAQSMGFATPQSAVGQTVYITANWGKSAQPVQILGVAETEPHGLEGGSAGVVYTFGPRALFGEQRPVVRLASDDVQAGVASINRVFGQIAPGIPADIRFYDQMFEQNYRQYARISIVFILLASTAFVIASIGLLGIAVHAASRRRHEIAVRKTLGSSVFRVVKLLLTDFSIPVLIGNIVAWPLGYFAAETYLAAFADRIILSPTPFLLSMAITLLIAWSAIIGVVLKAASVRPAEVLRHA
jgi:putative ABC transport system permease protein